MNTARTAISESVKQLRVEAIALLETLCATPANPSTGEGYAETVRIIAEFLEESGIPAQLVDVPHEFLVQDWGDDLKRSHEYIGVTEYAERGIVTAALTPGRPGAETAVHLTHNYDLWKGAREERAGTVAQLMAFKALKLSGVTLDKTVFFSATPDGHLGAETGAGFLAESGIGRCDNVITGNPGGFEVVTLGYKGKLWGKVTVRGRATHSARPDEGVNAIDQMMILQKHIQALDDSYRDRPSPWPVKPASAKRPTITTCRIESNEDGILVPDTCSIHIDRRVNPDETLAEAEQEVLMMLEAAAGDMLYAPELEWLREVESSGTDPDSTLARTVSNNIAEVTGRSSEQSVWPNYGGFRYFSTVWGASTVGYNPGRPVLDDRTLSDDELVAGIEVLALSVYDIATR